MTVVLREGKVSELAMCGPVKAVMMLLIVLYHCLCVYTGSWFGEPAEPAPALVALAGWLNTVHVPTFVLVSGYLYGYLKNETARYSSSRAVLAKKARRLLVPYAFVCLVWAVPWWVALFGPDRVAEKYVLGDSPSQLWFLLMLFWVFAMFEGLHRMAPGLLRRKGAMAILCLALYALGLALGKLLPLDLWQVESALQYCLLFWVGYAARGADTSRFWRVPPWGILAADLALCAGWACLGSSGLPGASLACAAALPFVRVAGALAAVSALGHLPALLERLRGGGVREGLIPGLPLPPAGRVAGAAPAEQARRAAPARGGGVLRPLPRRVHGDR